MKIGLVGAALRDGAYEQAVAARSRRMSQLERLMNRIITLNRMAGLTMPPIPLNHSTSLGLYELKSIAVSLSIKHPLACQGFIGSQ
jgi:hypothetical protein